MPTQHHTQTITLDNREAKLIELFRQAAIPIQTMNLPIGDIIIKHTLDLQQDVLALAEPHKERRITYEIILERKCTQDMVASIKDGRYKEQKIRLLAEGKNTTPDRSVVIGYIIEGTPAELRAPADKTMLLGSIISSTFRDNISILRTNSLQETFDLLVRLNERMMKDYNEFFPNSTNRCAESAVDQTFSASDSSGCGVAGVGGNDSYLASIKKNKKDNMTPSMWNMACLCGIPGVSSAIAIKIAERYPTLRALLDAYLACPDIVGQENLLADIILTETEKQRRRIGGVVSKRVYEYIHM
jgi:crossover junction endonuclease MUS81